MKTPYSPLFILTGLLAAMAMSCTLHPLPASAQTPTADDFNPAGPGGVGFAGSVNALAVQTDGEILASGGFMMVGAQPWANGFVRFNADGTADTNFSSGLSPGNASVSGEVLSLAVQPDGKILVGGQFGTLGGQPCANIGRLNKDGTLDNTFNSETAGGTDMNVNSLALQADGKILVGGAFTMLSGLPCNNLGRLNPDGTLDNDFNGGVEGPPSVAPVSSVTVQADGKILVGGLFTTLGGQPRANMGRLNADGTVDIGFNPGADGWVTSMALQPDGRILVSGAFRTLGGQSRVGIGRLNNTEPATQSLSFDGSTITWLRGGASPEVWRTTFEVSTNAADWTLLGQGARISPAGTNISAGWQLSSVVLPPGGTIRARGWVAIGQHVAGSCWYVETLLPPGGLVQQPQQPQILLSDGHFGFSTNGFGFNVSAAPGQAVVMQRSSDLVNWLPLQTNSLGSGQLYFTDPGASGAARQFYRAWHVP
jgi:uncharacterized delta-60 repeat protein